MRAKKASKRVKTLEATSVSATRAGDVRGGHCCTGEHFKEVTIHLQRSDKPSK
jgi:hypothetical protein